MSDDFSIPKIGDQTTTDSERGNLQFGRVIEVEVRNFELAHKIKLTNPLEISFNFFKTIDETNDSSTGVISISNLSDSTIEKISVVGSEVRLRCGYRHANNVELLFVASLVHSYPEYENGDVVTKLVVSANFQDFQFTNQSMNETQGTIASVVDMLRESMGIKVFQFRLDNIPKDKQVIVGEYLMTKAISFSASGTSQSVLESFCQTFGLIHHIENTEDSSILHVKIDDKFTGWMIRKSEQGYKKVNTSAANGKIEFNNLFSVQSAFDNQITTFSKTTGLLGRPKENMKIVLVPENWKVAGSESITNRGLETIEKNAAKDAERNKKYQERLEKAKESGKDIKPLKQRALGKIQVKRMMMEIETLLNPSVKPNSLVRILSDTTKYSGVYRVRTATYDGNNRSGKFTMKLFCEDSGGTHDSLPNERDLSQQEGVSIEDNASGISSDED